VQVAGHRESLPNAVTALREGSVLDVLSPQSKSVTMDKPAQAGMFFMLYELYTCEVYTIV